MLLYNLKRENLSREGQVRQDDPPPLSKLFRNVPLVNSLEVSPFCGSCFSVFLWFFCFCFSRGPCPERSPASPQGERLGRSGGRGPRPPLAGFLLPRFAGPLPPRRRRHRSISLGRRKNRDRDRFSVDPSPSLQAPHERQRRFAPIVIIITDRNNPSR